LTFDDDAVHEIARYAALVNEKTENIGARRLHTILERLLDELSFDASDMSGQSVNVDAAYVQRVLADVVKDEDLSRYVL
jgi:ATP-dependent HslUV protease ATP-binding subunit HslU